MEHLLPRKIKKACKSYRNYVPLKTKWLRYAHTQVLGRIEEYQLHMKDYEVSFLTRYGELLSEYIDYGKIV